MEISRFLLNQQYSFVFFLGPWLVVFCGVAIACGAIDTAISWYRKKIMLVRIVREDEEY